MKNRKGSSGAASHPPDPMRSGTQEEPARKNGLEPQPLPESGVQETERILESVSCGLPSQMALTSLSVRRMEDVHFQSQLLESVQDSIIATDLEERILYWGRGAERLYGYTAEEVMGKPYRNFAGPVHLEDVGRFRRELLAQGSAQGENEHRRKDGTRFWSAYRISVITDAAGCPCGFIGMDHDITERRQAAEALRESEERFRRLLDEIPNMAVQGYSPDGITQYWNVASERLYGYSAREAIGKNLLDLIIPPDMRKNVQEAIRWMVRTGQPISPGELDLLRKDGTLVPVFSSHHLLHVPGRPPEFFCLDIDLTERRRLEAEQQDLRAQLQQSQKMESVGRLAGGVAHDFNNMLQVIIGTSDMLLEQTDPTESSYADLVEIRNAGQRSADLTRQLLAFARRQPIKPVTVNLNDAVASMLKMLTRLIGENIRLSWKPGEDIGPIQIDPAQLDQILANLCVNARDAITGLGEIVIETENVLLSTPARLPELPPGEYVRMRFRDNGCGMDAATKAHLFEPFFTTKGLGRGTGLGLSTIYGIVKQNQGGIFVSSEPGQGTSFEIYFPRGEGVE